MKLINNPRLPTGSNDFEKTLVLRLYQLFQDISTQVNALSEGSIAANYNAANTIPIYGTYAQGDFVRNKSPTENGTAGSKYIVTGWVCITGGTPGAWREIRCLTGS